MEGLTEARIGSHYYVHLESLVEREQRAEYQRSNYLTKEWQDGLWQSELERTFKVGSPGSLMARSSPQSIISSPQSEISVVWRERICEWKFAVVDRFDIEREVVAISTYYLDQYLSTRYVDEELFQLVAITCIYLAIKLHSHQKVAIKCIASMGRGMVHPDHIVAMELSILQSLDWNLHPPTPLAFIENSFPLISGNVDAIEFSSFLSELSVCAYPFVCIKPSTIAIAANLIAIDHFGLGDDALASFRELLAGLRLNADAPDVLQCCKLLRHLHRLAVPDTATASSEESDIGSRSCLPRSTFQI